MQAPRKSIGTNPISKLKFNSLTRHYNTAFKHFTGKPSIPGALPDDFFSFTGIRQLPTTLIFAFLTSASFRTCLKYSAHFLLTCTPSRNILPLHPLPSHPLPAHLSSSALHFSKTSFCYPRNHSPKPLPIAGRP